MRALPAALLVCLLAGATAPAQPVSALWGRAGERWTPESRLPDFSHAGYGEGAARFPLARLAAMRQIDVTRAPYGADATGRTDASGAIQRALDAVADAGGGVVRLPRGRYRLATRIILRSSQTALVGDGPDATLLLPERGLREAFPDRNCRPGARAGTQACDRQVVFGGFLLVSPVAPAGMANPEMKSRVPNRDQRLCEVTGTHARGATLLRVAGPRCLAGPDALRPGDRVAVHVSAGRARDPWAATRYLWGDDFRQANYSAQAVPYPAACNNSTRSHMMPPTFRVEGDVLLARVVRTDPARGLVALDRGLRMPADPAGWATALWRVVPAQREVAITGLAIRFPDRPFGIAQLQGADRGEDALFLDGVADCVVDNVRITNAELGIFANRTRACTFSRVVLDGGPTRPAPDGTVRGTSYRGMIGKTGISINGQDNLLRDIRIGGIFPHDISLSQIANGNVVSHVQAASLSIDHHGNAPFENLYTDIDAGAEPTRTLEMFTGKPGCTLAAAWVEPKLFEMGGSSAVTRNMGVRNTYWNVRTAVPLATVPMFRAGNIRGPAETNLVGVEVAPGVAGGGTRTQPGGPWLERGRGYLPQDLYAAQVTRRLGRAPAY